VTLGYWDGLFCYLDWAQNAQKYCFMRVLRGLRPFAMSMTASPISLKTTFFVDHNGCLSCHVGSSAQTIINHKSQYYQRKIYVLGSV